MGRRPLQAAAELLQRSQDPVWFQRHVLGWEPTPAQQTLFRSAVKPNCRVAIRSGHKTGKTRFCAGLLLWFAWTQPAGRAVFTSPTYGNLAKVLWPEIRKLWLAADLRHKRFGGLGGTVYQDLSKGIEWSGGREVFGRTVREPEALQGISGNLLFVGDEASAIRQEIVEVMLGNAAGGARIVLVGNPTRVVGPFYDCFHDKRDQWDTHRISSLDSPNFGLPPERWIPGMATPPWAEDIRRQLGEDSPAYGVRVLGEFPRHASNAVVSLALVEDARTRHDDGERDPDAPLRLGVDVARFGDDETVIAVVRGRELVELAVTHGRDTVEVATLVSQIAARHRRYGEPPPPANVDTVGLGAGVYDQLVRGGDVRPQEVVASASPTAQPSVGPGYSTLRDQLWFAVAAWLADGASLPEDRALEGELVAPTYSTDARGRLKVAGKDEIRKTLGRSPDRADALCLAVYEAPEIDVSGWVPRPRAAAGGY